jgi:hypothetical protein
MAGLYQKTIRKKFLEDQRTMWKQITVEFTRNPIAIPNQDYQALQNQIFQPAIANPTGHLHLAEPIFVRQTPFQMSPPIFNVYDALAVIHTLLAELHGTNPWSPNPPEDEDPN